MYDSTGSRSEADWTPVSASLSMTAIYAQHHACPNPDTSESCFSPECPLVFPFCVTLYRATDTCLPNLGGGMSLRVLQGNSGKIPNLH
ncbi:hypothetical protein LSAT2_018669 [Lamellibrachia satsuma]|nr:hypothetical protein LSAT2_018669 [Lamellibrachia satsuma]